jgi:hypothetical protein
MRQVKRRQSSSGGLRRKNWQRLIRWVKFTEMNCNILVIKDVIAQMRKSMAEARGDPRSDTNPEVKVKVVLPEKPPIPPTKAVAVAKIREAIAQAKRESTQDLDSGTIK